MSTPEIKNKKVEYNNNNVVASRDATNIAKTYTIPLVSEETLNSEKNIEKLKTNIKKNNNVKSLDQKYAEIEEICKEYRINPKEARELGLLEGIAGCSAEELSMMSNENFEKVLKALKDSLGITGHWKMIWQNRDKEDIKEIIKEGSARYTRIATGGNFIGQIVYNCTKGSLINDLIDKGFLTKENCKSHDAVKKAIPEYIKQEYFSDINSLSDEEINKRYKQLKEDFGYMINQCKDAEEKALLVAVIKELRSDDKLKATEVLIRSEEINTDDRSKVATAVIDEHAEIVNAGDKFNRTVDKNTSINIAKVANDNMTASDIEKSNNKLSEEVNTLSLKEKNGTITEVELKKLYNIKNSLPERFTGSCLSINNNKKLSEHEKNILTNNVFKTIDNIEIKLGIDIKADVCLNIIKYLEENPEDLKLSPIELFKRVNRASEGKLLECIKQSEKFKAKFPNEVKLLEEKNNEVSSESIKEKITTTAKSTTTSTMASENKSYIYNENTNVVNENNTHNLNNNTRAQNDKKSVNATGNSSEKINKNNPNFTTSAQEPVNNTNISDANTTPETIDEAVKNNTIAKYKEKHGTIETIIAILSQNTKKAFDYACELYKRSNRQEKILSICSYVGVEQLLQYTKDSVLCNLQNYTSNNYKKTELISEASLEAQKRMNYNCKNSIYTT